MNQQHADQRVVHIILTLVDRTKDVVTQCAPDLAPRPMKPRFWRWMDAEDVTCRACLQAWHAAAGEHP